ncbi:MAG: putative maltokinase, partial [Verrucomicrobiota bacterium]|nr:putative maltokinase [Verrucomicrobiota bacterium]
AKVLDFWLNMGVDGLRLDAVPYLYEREGTSCENLRETHVYLKKLRAHVDAKYQGRMLLAEANQWPEDAVEYFGKGDESHMNFHFPLMPRMFMSLQMEDRFPIIDIMDQTPAIPDICQWAMFLRNHDELTLEMVTDEERDYMWRVYANDPTARINLGIRRRLAPLLANSRRKIELLNILLFSMPGTPVLYYGDEIGMGDNVYLGDRNGVRTPMQWSADRNAGFSRANPQQLLLPIIIDPEYNYEAINVENQQKNLSSLLWWTRRVIAMRKNYRAFSRGTLEFLFPDNAKVLAFLRQLEGETVLVVVNLSRFSQVAELDLSRFAGCALMEVFGQNYFPVVKEAPYVITLGPHSHYWFVLGAQPESATRVAQRDVPTLSIRGDLATLLNGDQRKLIEREVLPSYVRNRRWFGSKARSISGMRVAEEVVVSADADAARIWLVEVSYRDIAPETYTLPVTVARGAAARQVAETAPHAVIARLEGAEDVILHDAVWDAGFRENLFHLMATGQGFAGKGGEVIGIGGPDLSDGNAATASSQVLGVEQSNSSMIFDNKFFLKLYRKLEDGVNPDVEVTRFLSERTGFANVPAFAGAIEYRRDRSEPTVVCAMQTAVTSEGDAWAMTLDSVSRFYERVLAQKADLQSDAIAAGPIVNDLIGGIYPERAKLLGQRTAELHLALASETEDKRFVPEPFNAMAQRSVFQNMRALLRRSWEMLGKKLEQLPPNFRDEAVEVLAAEKQILALQQRILEQTSGASKIRIHGDYHLGQVLYTGKDFIILDFEGEPARALSERKLKRSALRDVAGMMRSFQYAAYSALWQPAMRPEDIPFLERWADIWYRQMGSVFLQSYLSTTRGATFIPQHEGNFAIMLEAYLLDKAVYEVGYELNNRPDWVVIPLRGIKHILQQS